MDRINVLANHLRGSPDGNALPIMPQYTRATESTPYDNFPQAQTMANFPPAVHDLFEFDQLLTEEERAIRYKTRAYMEKEVAPVIADFWERAEFPFQLLPGLGKLNIASSVVKGYGCPGLSVVGAAMAAVETARVDGSISTFILVHGSLCCLTIGLLGSEKQKQELVPQMADLSKVGAWALTEPSNGSDASALESTARKVEGGWILNGRKRWIGNATFADIVVYWARNTTTKEINAFVVRKGTKGFRTSKIENKISLRCVQNANIFLDDCFVRDCDRLPGVDSFKDTNKVLAISRILVAWQPVGLAAGVYDMVLRYTKERKQFNTPIAAFQITQEKIARMAGNIQAMWLMAWRLSRLHEQGEMSHEMASVAKAWNTARGREVVALGRELLGGNGIVSDFLVAKAFCDLEAYHTYEGTYEINTLVAGRGATGLASFKAPPGRQKAVGSAEGLH